MELSPGYKQTEVGMRPEEWEVTRLGQFVALRRGHDLTERARRKGEIPVLGSAGLNGFHDTALVRGPGLVLGRSGASFGQAHYCSADFWPHNTALYVTDFFGNYPLFAFYFLKSIDFSRHNTGGAQQSLNRNFIGPIPISVPDRKEQEAIAEALSDADALIESLEQLLAKKRQIKQGTMQELLTGKERLPGFPAPWETKRLGDFGSTFGGLTGKSKRDFDHGPAQYITFMNIMSNVVIDCQAFARVDVKHTETQNRVLNGDIFFNGSSETPEEVGMCAVLTENVQDVYLNSFCFGFRFRERSPVDGLYLAYYFRSREGRELLKSLAQGATRYNLSKTALLKLCFPLPSYKEQIAIATILSDMDAEIAVLETKLAKARQIKQGMMQELLTGRIRLV